MNSEIPVTEEISVLCDVSDRKNLKAAVKYSYTGGIITGAGAMLGGLLFGPIGFPIGGLIGGCLAAVATRNKFVAVSKIISDLSDDEKEALIAHVKRRLSLVGPADAVKLGISLLNDKNVLESIAKFITEFLCDVKNMKIDAPPK